MLPRGLGALARQARDAQLIRMKTPAEAAALDLPKQPEVLTAVRDEAFIRWRHFESNQPDRAVFALRQPGRPDALVVVDQSRRGYRFHIRALNVLDFWGDIGRSDVEALAAALAREYRGKFDMMIIRTQPPDRQEALQQLSFRRRVFDAPIAWCIDKPQHLPTQQWYLTPGDAE